MAFSATDRRPTCRLAIHQDSRLTLALDPEDLRLAAAISERFAGECPPLAVVTAHMPPLERPAPARNPSDHGRSLPTGLLDHFS